MTSLHDYIVDLYNLLVYVDKCFSKVTRPQTEIARLRPSRGKVWYKEDSNPWTRDLYQLMYEATSFRSHLSWTIIIEFDFVPWLSRAEWLAQW